MPHIIKSLNFILMFYSYIVLHIHNVIHEVDKKMKRLLKNLRVIILAAVCAGVGIAAIFIELKINLEPAFEQGRAFSSPEYLLMFMSVVGAIAAHLLSRVHSIWHTSALLIAAFFALAISMYQSQSNLLERADRALEEVNRDNEARTRFIAELDKQKARRDAKRVAADLECVTVGTQCVKKEKLLSKINADILEAEKALAKMKPARKAGTRLDRSIADMLDITLQDWQNITAFSRPFGLQIIGFIFFGLMGSVTQSKKPPRRKQPQVKSEREKRASRDSIIQKLKADGHSQAKIAEMVKLRQPQVSKILKRLNA